MLCRVVPDCLIPKIHYCKHCIDCWKRTGRPSTCYGAEQDHKQSKQIFAHCYNKPCKTTLAIKIKKFLACVDDPNTFQETYLAPPANICNVPNVQVAGLGQTPLVATSLGIVYRCGELKKKDLLHSVEMGTIFWASLGVSLK